jgi:hypothetical protein
MRNKQIKKAIQTIREVKDKYRREVLKLRRIDVDQLDSLTLQYDESMTKPLADIRRQLAKGAEEIKANQFKILTEIQKFPKVDKLLVEAVPLTLPELRPPYKIIPLCCRHLQTLYYSVLCDHSISPSTGTILNGNKASVNCDSSINSCYPFLELHGGGAGVTRELTVNGWCSFAFNPTSVGTYCIEPFIMINGYYLFQTWGSCTGGVTSNATLKITATVIVKQLGITVNQRRVTIYEHTSADGQFSPLDFTQQLNTPVRLDYIGHTATIEVGIEVESTITGNGQIIVDIQKNPNFYFRVPYVDIGRLSFCWEKFFPQFVETTS